MNKTVVYSTTIASVLLMSVLGFSTLSNNLAEANPGNQISIILDCPGTGNSGLIQISNSGGFVLPGGVCTVNGGVTSFPSGSNLAIKIKGELSGTVELRIIDDPNSSTSYKITGGASNDLVEYFDDTGNDKVDFRAMNGKDRFRINDDSSSGSSHDEYSYDGGKCSVCIGTEDDTWKINSADADSGKANMRS